MGLTGEVRGTWGVESVVSEAIRAGYEELVVGRMKVGETKKLKVKKVTNSTLYRQSLFTCFLLFFYSQIIILLQQFSTFCVTKGGNVTRRRTYCLRPFWVVVFTWPYFVD